MVVFLRLSVKSPTPGDSRGQPRYIILWRSKHFILLNTIPRFFFFLQYDRCKSGLTFIQSCSGDVLGAKSLFYFVSRQSPYAP